MQDKVCKDTMEMGSGGDRILMQDEDMIVRFELEDKNEICQFAVAQSASSAGVVCVVTESGYWTWELGWSSKFGDFLGGG